MQGKSEFDYEGAIERFTEVYDRYENKSALRKLLQSQYQDVQIPTVPTLKKITENCADVHTMRGGIRVFLEKFVSQKFVDDNNYIILYAAMRKKMHLSVESQVRYKQYIGTYDVFRRGTVDKYIIGNINIAYHGGAPWFFHYSKQTIGDVEESFDHDGPVFISGSRLYLFGIGKDYIRQMTLQAIDRPDEHTMSGIVLTERYENLRKKELVAPLAAKTVLVRRGVSVSDAELEACLRNEATLEGVLYGWRA